MQLLFDGSDEGPGTGLGLIAGRVERLRTPLVPHMGWNTLHDARDPLVPTAALEDGVLRAQLRMSPRGCRRDDGVDHGRDERFPPSCVEGILSACSSIPKKARPPACGSFTPF